MSHLLSLAALHAAAPGVLGVVFGADGEFEGAPPWAGPIYVAQTIAVGGGGHMLPGGWIVSVDPRSITPSGIWFPDGGPVTPWSALALDLRTSASERVAKLCGLALGFNLFPGSAVSAYKHGNYCHLSTSHGMQEVTWGPSGCPMLRGCGPPNLPAGLSDAPSFLSALTMALAPRIRDLAKQEP
jgi:hypothetical protein